MGSCISTSEDGTHRTHDPTPIKKITAQKETNKHHFYQTVQCPEIIMKCIKRQLNDLCPTEEQLIEIMNQIKMINFEVPESMSKKQKEAVNVLIKNWKGQDLNTLMIKIKNDDSAPRLRSRMLYQLTNHIDDAYFQSLNITKLKPEQIDELVLYEHIEHQAELFTDSFFLKFIEIKTNTEKFRQLFCECFSQHHQILDDERFLDLQNGLEAAKFSRQGCSFDKRAIFIFLNFLVRLIWKFQKQGKSIGDIEKLVSFLIETLSKLYPPGQDLIGGNQNLKNTLQKIEVIWDKQNQPLKNNPPIIFRDTIDKRKQLEDQVKKRAEIAAEELPFLNNIIRENCLKKCIGVDSNLKLYAQAQNPKALIRITEKLLFKEPKPQQKQQETNKFKEMKGEQKQKLENQYRKQVQYLLNQMTNAAHTNEELRNHLQNQQRKYQAEVQNKLKDKQSVQFTLSDLVRGKCTFSRIEDIIETIEDIKQYVQNQRSINPERYRILQIESRFTKEIPISDITLKIALNERMIAELQLTLQNNVATYAFAHKIYELQRSKAFSKIKTIFNYYSEYQEQFEDLVVAQMAVSKLCRNKEDKMIQKMSQSVKKYFQIEQNDEISPLTRVLNQIGFTKNGFEQKHNILVQAVFDRKMLKKDEERAHLFQEHLIQKKDSYSQAYRSALFYQVIKDISITENLDSIYAPFDDFFYYLNKQILNKEQSVTSLAVDYLSTSRVYIKFKQLAQLFTIYKKGGDTNHYQKYLIKVYGNNQQVCEWLIKKGNIYEQIKQYKKAIQSYNTALEIYQNNEYKELRLIRKVEFNKARLLLKLCSYRQAQDLLQKVTAQYKQAKQYKYGAICTLLLSQCALKQNKKKDFHEYYKKARQIADMHKFNFGGPEIADCQYRIGTKLKAEPGSKQQALDIHLRVALQEYGEFMHPQRILEKIREVWEDYSGKKIEEPQFKQNQKIEKIQILFDQISDQDCKYFSKPNWPNIRQLILFMQNVGPQGCEHLRKGSWHRLQAINLSMDKIGALGSEHLSKAVWPNLKILSLRANRIGDEGCGYLKQGDWPNLQELYLNKNQIGRIGCKSLSEGNWKNLEELHVQQNSINGEGCEYLTQTEWLNIKKIGLSDNKIDGNGCTNLAKAEWPDLEVIYLENNLIDDRGCQHLISTAKWPKLQTIKIANNHISQQTIETLKSSFPTVQVHS